MGANSVPNLFPEVSLYLIQEGWKPPWPPGLGHPYSEGSVIAISLQKNTTHQRSFSFHNKGLKIKLPSLLDFFGTPNLLCDSPKWGGFTMEVTATKSFRLWTCSRQRWLCHLAVPDLHVQPPPLPPPSVFSFFKIILITSTCSFKTIFYFHSGLKIIYIYLEKTKFVKERN